MSISTNIAEATLEAADAYIDFSGTYTYPDGATTGTYVAHNVGFKFKLTQPGEAGGDAFGSYCVVIVRAQDPAGTDIKRMEKRLYYDETSSDTIYIETWLLDLLDGVYPFGGLAQSVARARVDFYGINGTYAPTLELYQVRLWNFLLQSTMAEITIKG